MCALACFCVCVCVCVCDCSLQLAAISKWAFGDRSRSTKEQRCCLAAAASGVVSLSKSAPDRLLMGTRVSAPHTMGPTCFLSVDTTFRSQLGAYKCIFCVSLCSEVLRVLPVNNGTGDYGKRVLVCRPPSEGPLCRPTSPGEFGVLLLGAGLLLWPLRFKWA